MKGKKILFISSEVVPYMPQTEISTLTYALPKLVNDNGGQTRLFIPKYGNINERRHQLHEVIRLSGINLIIDDMDMPLILKVASIPKERMQVYFIDNEDYIVSDSKSIPEGLIGLDIGPKTLSKFKNIISKSKTIVWNGPMGVFEFNRGTKIHTLVIAPDNSIHAISPRFPQSLLLEIANSLIDNLNWSHRNSLEQSINSDVE